MLDLRKLVALMNSCGSCLTAHPATWGNLLSGHHVGRVLVVTSRWMVSVKIHGFPTAAFLRFFRDRWGPVDFQTLPWQDEHPQDKDRLLVDFSSDFESTELPDTIRKIPMMTLGAFRSRSRMMMVKERFGKHGGHSGCTGWNSDCGGLTMPKC